MAKFLLFLALAHVAASAPSTNAKVMKHLLGSMAVQVGDKEFSELTPEVTAGFKAMLTIIETKIEPAIAEDYKNTQTAITTLKKSFVVKSDALDAWEVRTKFADTQWYKCLALAAKKACECTVEKDKCIICQKKCTEECKKVDPIYEWRLPDPHFGEKTCDLEIHDEPRDCPPLKALDDKTTAIGKDIADHYSKWKAAHAKCKQVCDECKKQLAKCDECEDTLEKLLDSCDAKRETFQEHGCKFGDLWKTKCEGLRDFFAYVRPTYATYEVEVAQKGSEGITVTSEPDRSHEWASMQVVKCVIRNYAPINSTSQDTAVKGQNWPLVEKKCTDAVSLNDRTKRHEKYQKAVGKMDYYRADIVRENQNLACHYNWPAGTFVDTWKKDIWVNLKTMRTTMFYKRWWNPPAFVTSADGMVRFGEIKPKPTHPDYKCPIKDEPKEWNFHLDRKLTETNDEGLCE